MKMVLPSRRHHGHSKLEQHSKDAFRLLTTTLFQWLQRSRRSLLIVGGLVSLTSVFYISHKSRPYYYGPPVDIFLEPVNEQLSTSLGPSCAQSLRETTEDRNLAVIVIGSSRPDYLGQVLDSLAHQSVDTFHVYIFLDFCETDGCDQVLELVELQTTEQNFNHEVERYSFQRAKQNLGIARMSKWAIETTLKDGWERFLFMEDDHLVGHTYVEAMGYLLNAAVHLPKVAVVNGNFVDTPPLHARGQLHERRPYCIKERDRECHFQIVEPVHANTDVNGHDVWAWATTRTKYHTMQSTFQKAFQEAKLDNTTISYMNRNRTHIAETMNRYCPGSGYNQWGSQDWLRACMFYHHGMTQKLQPTERLMTYIGMHGLHMTPQVFQQLGFQPVPVEDVSQSVASFPEDLCDGVCHFRVVEQYDRWAPFRNRKEIIL